MQLELTLSPRSQGEHMGALCLKKAVRVSDFDSLGAAKFIEGHLRRFGPTSGEDCTDAAVAHGYHCPDRRAFGPVYARLVREKRIRCVGFCERKYGHGTAGGRIWEAVSA